MTTYYGLFDEHGKCVSTCTSSHGMPLPDLIPQGLRAVETDGMIDTSAVRLDGETVQPLPPRPSDHHHFCHESCAWQLDEDRAWATMRARRDAMLTASDWVVIRAHELGQEVPPEWMVYRQTLRDIPQQFSDPLTIVWPVAPQT